VRALLCKGTHNGNRYFPSWSLKLQTGETAEQTRQGVLLHGKIALT